jgi:hypothetical protein
MPYNFFYGLSKAIEIEVNKIKDIPQIKGSPRKPSGSTAPTISTTSEERSMKKIKSEEDFVKLQVPWIM